MSIFNNPAVKYNYEEGNGVTLSSFNEPTSTISNVIGSSTIPQVNVKDLKKDLSALATGFEESYNEFNLFKSNQIFVNDNTKRSIDYVQVIVDINKSIQEEWNKETLAKIEFLTKESMIMFFMVILLFVIDLAVLWLYIRK